MILDREFREEKIGELRNELLEMLGKTSPNKLLLLPKKKIL